ncbi:hypothetical protein DXG01_005388 [Tephrocybe rancida]|nr:hypothetical protein DXG01_005388 [Tephrocybe rancida]
MPSLRTIFVVAAASFATLVFAAPTGIISRSGLDPLTNNAAKEPLSALPTTADVSGTSTPIESGSDVLQTLPVILSAAKEKLDTVFCNLNSTISGSGLIDADLVAPFIGQTHDILVELLASAKTLIGHPEEIILGVDGTVKEVADLLHAILTVSYLRFSFTA